MSGITCYKCKQTGHYANKCPGLGQGNTGGSTKQKRQEFEQGEYGDGGGTGTKAVKTCNVCGHTGRHPRGSTCPTVKRKQTKKGTGNEENGGDDYNFD